MFAGKHIVITGGGDGIGKALTLKFIEQGATVSVIDINQAKLTELELHAKKYGQQCKGYHADVSSIDEMTNTLTAICAFKSEIDIWINNAGVSGLGDFMSLPFSEFERTLNINLKGVALGTRLAIKVMEPRGTGMVVNMASIAGHVSAPYLSAYCASKFGVIGFSHALREELRIKEVPIKICVVSPGFVDTKILEREKEGGFPEWLTWVLSTAESVADEIVSGIRKGREDIYPTWNGRFMIGAGSLLPGLARKSSRILLSKSLRDVFLFRKTPPS